MSSTPRQYFRSDDLVMIGRVLDRADFHKSVDPTRSEARQDAARFLIASFQQGATDEVDLRSRLAGRMQDKAAPIAVPPLDTASLVSGEHDSGDRRITQSHQFGKRVETNGSWTIYHVFTGVPAKFGSREMVKLDVKTAVRALRILNAPPPDTEAHRMPGSAGVTGGHHARRHHVSMADRARAFDKYD